MQALLDVEADREELTACLQREVSLVHVRVGTDLHKNSDTDRVALNTSATTNNSMLAIATSFSESAHFLSSSYWMTKGVLHCYLFLELGIFADFVNHVRGRDDSPARHNGADHLQCTDDDRVGTHAVKDLIS
jgi:hypothetical protein